MEITTKMVTRRGNAVGHDSAGRIVTVEPRPKVKAVSVRTYLDNGAMALPPVDSQTFTTLKEACAYASVIVVKPLRW